MILHELRFIIDTYKHSHGNTSDEECNECWLDACGMHAHAV